MNTSGDKIIILVSVTLAILLIAALLTYLYRPVKKDYNCSDFKTQKEAQDFLSPGDPYHLDANRDGIACNALPK